MLVEGSGRTRSKNKRRSLRLRFFYRFNRPEIAFADAISPATVKREWATAKIWLRLGIVPDSLNRLLCNRLCDTNGGTANEFGSMQKLKSIPR